MDQNKGKRAPIGYDLEHVISSICHSYDDLANAFDNAEKKDAQPIAGHSKLIFHTQHSSYSSLFGHIL